MARKFPQTVWKGIAKGGLPFDISMPNARTMKAIRNSRAGKGKRISTPRELVEDLGM
jgi:antitoxin component of RelBE/YafQ-DinJ toxin-antitoxin module